MEPCTLLISRGLNAVDRIRNEQTLSCLGRDPGREESTLA